MIDDLVTWLRAYVDEDERRAEAAIHAGLGVDLGPDGHMLSDSPDVQNHLATWNPARVLREVEAKRRLLDAHAEYDGVCPRCFAWQNKPVQRERWPCEVARLLALPYADRPGYKEEWKL